MSRLIALVLCFLSLCLPVLAAGEGDFQPSRTAIRKELVQVVEAQLTAFRVGNTAKAYSYASTEIQKNFSLSNFEAMVKATYPAIAHSVSAKFGPVLDDGSQAVVHVAVIGTNKRRVIYGYLLVRQKGKWRISGVFEADQEQKQGELST
jgi:hypothetical protein